MEEIRRDGNKVVVAVSVDELRLLTGALNEALTGPYAVPADEWMGLIGQSPERADALLDALVSLLEG